MAAAMSKAFGAGFDAAPGKVVDASAYEQWTGLWSRLFTLAVVAAAAVAPKFRVLDVSTGTGEAARMALSRNATGFSDILAQELNQARRGAAESGRIKASIQRNCRDRRIG
jgi:hypothetical protein